MDGRTQETLGTYFESSLKDYLQTQGLFGLIHGGDMRYSLADSILEEVKLMAQIMYPKKARRITNFIKQFPKLNLTQPNGFPNVEPKRAEFIILIYQTICKEFIDQVGIPENNSIDLCHDELDIKSLK